MIRPGPCFSLENLEFRLARLFGAFYEGEIWTTGYELTRDEPGELRVISLKFSAPKIWSRMRFWVHAVLRGIRLRRRNTGPMIVVSYDPFTSGTAGLVLKWLTGARFVVEVNGSYGSRNTFVESKASLAGGLKRRLMALVSVPVLRSADTVKLLYPGQLEGLPVDEESLPVVRFFNSVDTQRYGAPPTRSQEDVILFAGHPFLLKGVDVLIEAFSRLQPEFPSWRLILMGFDLENGARRAGVNVPERTDFLGAQRPDVVEEWMERCKIFVLPSRSEAMGRVLLEAGLKGRARVASAVGGIPHYIRDDIDGLLFPPGDTAALTASLRRLMTTPELRERLEKEARRSSHEQFTEAGYVDRYDQMIREVSSLNSSSSA